MQLIKVSIFMFDVGDDMCFTHIKGAICKFLDPESLNFDTLSSRGVNANVSVFDEPGNSFRWC